MKQLLALILAALVGSANAVTVDFETDMGGFVFSNTGVMSYSNDPTKFSDSGDKFLAIGVNESGFGIRRADGSDFQFVGANFHNRVLSNENTTVSFQFILPDGSVVGENGETDRKDYPVYVLNPGQRSFLGLSQPFNVAGMAILFKNKNDWKYLGIDNFQANVSAVPEPGSYAMLLAGLGAVGFMSRRRKN